MSIQLHLDLRLSLWEYLFTGPQIQTFREYQNDKCFKRVGWSFYLHYNPCEYKERVNHHPFVPTPVEILSEIQTMKIKYGPVNDLGHQIDFKFKLIKPKEPINILGISMYVWRKLLVRAGYNQVVVYPEDSLNLSYTLTDSHQHN